MGLHIGQKPRGGGFHLPLDLITQTAAVLGVRGSGKTNTGVIFAEELLARGQQVIVIDPLDVWWGLRAGAKGKASGIPIVVLGGERGDLPLEAAGGRTVAEFLVEKRASAILSTRHLSKGDQRRFVTDFAERLYELKGRAKNRTPLHLLIDEADLFAPQRLFHGMERLFGAVDSLVRRGRASGVGVTLITQRAAVLSKDVLTQCEMLVCHRTIGPQDRKAIEAWIEVHDVEDKAAEVLGTLHKLERGETWIWSPGWLGVLERVQIRARRTFDSSATPKVGQAPRAPKRLTPVDLAGLRAALAETVERAKAEDPRELHRKIVDLERQLVAAGRPAAHRQDPAADEVHVEKAVAQALRDSGKKQSAFMASMKRFLSGLSTALQSQREGAEALLVQATELIASSRPPASTRTRGGRTLAVPAPSAAAGRKPQRREATVTDPDAEKDLGGGKQRMLVALAQRPQGLSARSLGVRAGISVKGGSFGTYLGRLRARGWVEGGRECIRITEAGLAALGDCYEPLPTGRDLLDHWMRQLGASGKARMLRTLADAWPQSMTAEDLGEASDVSTQGGSFGTYLGNLRALELVQGGRSNLRVADELMEEA